MSAMKRKNGGERTGRHTLFSNKPPLKDAKLMLAIHVCKHHGDLHVSLYQVEPDAKTVKLGQVPHIKVRGLKWENAAPEDDGGDAGEPGKTMGDYHHEYITNPYWSPTTNGVELFHYIPRAWTKGAREITLEQFQDIANKVMADQVTWFNDFAEAIGLPDEWQEY